MSGRITVSCWKCGTLLKDLLLPFSRYEECSTCKADLHCCLSCHHYAENQANSCKEDRADFVLDKGKANFCDFFKANPNAFKNKDNSEAELAKAKLAELFGDTPAPQSTEDSMLSESDKALAELKRLFDDE